MKKIYVVSFAAILVVCSVIFIFAIGNSDSDNSQFKETDKGIEIMESAKQSTENVNVSVSVQENISAEDNTNSDTTQFIYDLKKTYTSRDEIKQELDRLETAYYNFIVNKNIEARNAAEKKYDECEKILFEWLERFPPDDAEILKQKENLLNQKVFFDKEDLFVAEKNLANDSPDIAKEKLEYAKKEYEHSCSVSKAYENGEITIEEALDKLGLTYENKE